MPFYMNIGLHSLNIYQYCLRIYFHHYFLFYLRLFIVHSQTAMDLLVPEFEKVQTNVYLNSLMLSNEEMFQVHSCNDVAPFSTFCTYVSVSILNFAVV